MIVWLAFNQCKAGGVAGWAAFRAQRVLSRRCLRRWPTVDDNYIGRIETLGPGNGQCSEEGVDNMCDQLRRCDGWA